jgi:hypothetical protein
MGKKLSPAVLDNWSLVFAIAAEVMWLGGIIVLGAVVPSLARGTLTTGQQINLAMVVCSMALFMDGSKKASKLLADRSRALREEEKDNNLDQK